MAHARFAQHFLINQHAAQRIVDALSLKPTDRVLEIGPGRGALTRLLVLKSCPVVAIEVDKTLAAFLKKDLGSKSNLDIREADFLEFDLNSLLEGTTQKFVVLGNLPYNLTSPILRRLSEWTGWSHGCVMVQKEVGERLCADVGTAAYGALTVGMSLTTRLEPLFILSPTSFNPPPNVESMVVRLTRREKPLTNEISTAQRVIQAAFQQRRKMILNSLAHAFGETKEEVKRWLENAGIRPDARPERIGVNQFVALSEFLAAHSLDL